jgi:hypothetical protein
MLRPVPILARTRPAERGLAAPECGARERQPLRRVAGGVAGQHALRRTNRPHRVGHELHSGDLGGDKLESGGAGHGGEVVARHLEPTPGDGDDCMRSVSGVGETGHPGGPADQGAGLGVTAPPAELTHRHEQGLRTDRRRAEGGNELGTGAGQLGRSGGAERLGGRQRVLGGRGIVGERLRQPVGRLAALHRGQGVRRRTRGEQQPPASAHGSADAAVHRGVEGHPGAPRHGDGSVT